MMILIMIKRVIILSEMEREKEGERERGLF